MTGLPVETTSPATPQDQRQAFDFTRRRHWEILGLACMVVVVSCLLRVLPNQRIALMGLPELPLPNACPSRTWFGVQCPGCGLTRSFVHLAHGDWRASLQVHRVGWIIAAAVLFQIPYRIHALRKGGRGALHPSVTNFVIYTLVALLLANWLWNLFAGTLRGG